MLLCSDSDTLPTVVLEAMSFGCVVFARNVDGVPEIITNGEDGIIFDYNAKPEAIAQKIYDVFSNGSNNYIVYSDTYYFGTEFSEHNLVPSIYTRDDLIDSENKEYLGEEYTLEGIYYDESCLIPFSENRARTSQEENIYNYYRHYII